VKIAYLIPDDFIYLQTVTCTEDAFAAQPTPVRHPGAYKARPQLPLDVPGTVHPSYGCCYIPWSSCTNCHQPQE